MNQPLKSGDFIRVVKGNRARGFHAHEVWQVSKIEDLGKDYGYTVAISLARMGRIVKMYARHANRLSDHYINLNDGNPLHKIQISRR